MSQRQRREHLASKKIKHKKIIWIAHEANLSGANLCVLEYMQLLSHTGSNQILVLPHIGNMQQKASEMGVKTVIIPFYGWGRRLNENFLNKGILKRLLRNSLAFFQFSILFLKSKPSIVCTNTITHAVGALASKFTSTKHVWFIHEMGEEDFGFSLALGKLSYKLMNFTSQKVFVNSEFVATKFRKVLPTHKITVVYNPVMVNTKYKPTVCNKGEEIKLLMLGQISPVKGHMDAIKALKILVDRGLSVTLNIFGSCEIPTYENELKKFIIVNKLTNVVFLKGSTSNASETITQHHILLVCSVCEAMGRVALEAMKLGVPVIGANTGGTLEIIGDGQNGFLYEQGNEISLAEKVDFLLNLPDIRPIINAAFEKSKALTNKGVLAIEECIENFN